MLDVVIATTTLRIMVLLKEPEVVPEDGSDT